jgi:AhpD family alkylhydroperoxidase
MRLDYASVLPAAPQALLGVEKVIASSSLEPTLLELVKVRASQINGCAFCLDMHTKDARAIGEDEQRLHLVAVWREASCFSERERAALAWSEAVTLSCSPRAAPPTTSTTHCARYSRRRRSSPLPSRSV